MQDSPDGPRFVIVGAGMAGILSAVKLQEAGYTDFTIRPTTAPAGPASGVLEASVTELLISRAPLQRGFGWPRCSRFLMSDSDSVSHGDFLTSTASKTNMCSGVVVSCSHVVIR